MYYFTPRIGIERIAPPLDPLTLRLRARQVSQFMVGVHQYYKWDLRLRHIDTDPPPDPRNNALTEWRMGRLTASGQVEEDGLEFLAAFALRNDGTPVGRLDAIKALLVLDKPERLCGPNGHTPTRILEWDVDGALRGQGLGRAILRAGVIGIHAEDPVILDVSKDNPDAIAVYEHYGFERDLTVPPQELGVFATQHLRYGTTAQALLGKLGVAS